MRKKKSIFALFFAIIFAAAFFACAPQDDGGQPQGGHGSEEEEENMTETLSSARADFWWGNAASVTDNIYLYVGGASTAVTDNLSVRKDVTATGGADKYMHTLSLTNIFYDHALFPALLRNAAIDYKTQQVYLAVPRPSEISDASYREAVASAVTEARRAAPEARVFAAVKSAADKTLCEGAIAGSDIAGKDDVAVLYGENDAALAAAVQAVLDEGKRSVTQRPPEASRSNTVAIREGIQWNRILVSDFKNVGSRPRVLLIGDSISEGYGNAILGGGVLDNYTVDCFRTARGVQDDALMRELKWLLDSYRYDYIHFNIGLHHHNATTEAYRQNMSDFIENGLREYENGAKLLFSNSTPWFYVQNPPPAPPIEHPILDTAANAKVAALNETMRALCAEIAVPYNDLHAYVLENNIPMLDTVHYYDYSGLAENVASFIKSNKLV
ncbi:MAG: SGNH/GDSL hydrolase family protein [Clostridiales bacterium]|jgi:hypothetical protein|nr:SGNH/GDSL hydrolase family protein [Clostridiales bacterium]